MIFLHLHLIISYLTAINHHTMKLPTLTQAQLTERIGANKGSISRIEH